MNWIKWRVVAAYHIAWWFCKGAPMGDWPEHWTRWHVTKLSWRWWRDMIACNEKVRTVEEFLTELREERNNEKV